VFELDLFCTSDMNLSVVSLFLHFLFYSKVSGIESSIFRVLPVYLTPETDILSVLFFCSTEEFPPLLIRESYLNLISHFNQTLSEISQTALRYHRYYHLSHHFNFCRQIIPERNKEILLHISLALWPWNTYSCKNLGYFYENLGYFSLTKDLYHQHYHLVPNHGTLLQNLFTLPFFFQEDEFLSLRCYLEIIFQSVVILRSHLLTSQTSSLSLSPPLTRPQPQDDPTIPVIRSLHPMYEIRAFQLNIEYLGFSPGVVMEIYSLCLWKLFSAHFAAPQSSLAPPTTPAGQ
jgi:hypothetical protein